MFNDEFGAPGEAHLLFQVVQIGSRFINFSDQITEFYTTAKFFEQ